jgi:2-polyprenyl-3-methyl-5-hydroxy-6-metoxy-1,4-benzoquinol methylase
MAIDNDKAEKQNQLFWDEVAPVHFKSYDIASLRKGISLIDEIQKKELYPVAGKELLHLQCHIGTDSISLAYDGAKVTAVDFSKVSIELAQQLDSELGTKVDFIQANIFDLKQKLNKKFDIVYTSKGVLPWIKDIKKWAALISYFLKPEGIFYLMEIHPFKPIFDDTLVAELKIKYSYFHNDAPLTWDDEYPDYADKGYIPKNKTYEWSWTISDIIGSLLDEGLQLILFREYDKLFFQGLPGMINDGHGWWYLDKYKNMIPYTFTLKAKKSG